ncbi:DUF6507 family protein [Arthrobacter sp. NPDC056727]|uniref:DUF6507 family protein n=1 Tax=Arthrobacter sp. NPDC056727 TaxID=3345927 RepID=UPI00366FC50F
MVGVWNIDVPASAATIKSAATQLAAVEPELTGIETSLNEAAAAIPGEAAGVLAALSDVLTAGIAPATREVLERSGTIFTSTAQALSFYEQGDLTMAAASQRSAAVITSEHSARPGLHGPAPM